MPHIVTLRSKSESNHDVINLVLSQDAITLGPEGDPWCGVTLSAEQARCLARRLSSMATEIENHEEGGYRTSSRSFLHLSSVVAIHDGSQQSHRAYQAALHFARQSLANLHLMVISGIAYINGELTTSSGDIKWQAGWLPYLAERYAEQAAVDGISFNSRVFPAHDPCSLLDSLYRMDFDLIVIPNMLTQFGLHGERLLPSVVSRCRTNVLVCL